YGCGTLGYGTVFSMSTTGGTPTTLYTFTGAGDGGRPGSKVIQAKDGNFYGTTVVGGSDNAGVVFELSPAGSQTTLYSFTNGIDGGFPNAGLVQARNGILYGSTTPTSSNNGTLFSI